MNQRFQVSMPLQRVQSMGLQDPRSLRRKKEKSLTVKNSLTMATTPRSRRRRRIKSTSKISLQHMGLANARPIDSLPTQVQRTQIFPNERAALRECRSSFPCACICSASCVSCRNIEEKRLTLKRGCDTSHVYAWPDTPPS